MTTEERIKQLESEIERRIKAHYGKISRTMSDDIQFDLAITNLREQLFQLRDPGQISGITT